MNYVFIACYLCAGLTLDTEFLEQTVLFVWTNLQETERKTRMHWRHSSKSVEAIENSIFPHYYFKCGKCRQPRKNYLLSVQNLLRCNMLRFTIPLHISGFSVHILLLWLSQGLHNYFVIELEQKLRIPVHSCAV